jgi:hypothetical protein
MFEVQEAQHRPDIAISVVLRILIPPLYMRHYAKSHQKTMTGLDQELISHARRYITGANVHRVKTWIFCYETSLSGTVRRARCEGLLRDFVSSQRVVERMRREIEAERDEVARLKAVSSMIDEGIDGFFRLI